MVQENWCRLPTRRWIWEPWHWNQCFNYPLPVDHRYISFLLSTCIRFDLLWIMCTKHENKITNKNCNWNEKWNILWIFMYFVGWSNQFYLYLCRTQTRLTKFIVFACIQILSLSMLDKWSKEDKNATTTECKCRARVKIYGWASTPLIVFIIYSQGENFFSKN